MSDSHRGRISVTPRGPYIASGIEEVVTATGEHVTITDETALCRCGFSKNKPFCDGAHGPYQFSKAPQTDPVPETTKAYRGGVEVRYNPALCAHIGVCTRDLPEVFDTSRRPWILPDNADAARVRDVVGRCPSGALTMADATTPPSIDDAPPPTEVRALPDGPLAVSGAIELDGIQFPDGAPRDRCTLCRCGASRTMPFCDDSHRDIGFTDGPT